ncbi:MAG: hypothetical protein JSW11_08330 [Candidatus Heimdallarchaeota archaeon]|nr:MAG: hypothetical protein JSW11_08330 [Candidatus Heimdallarchaeota archaeon]
MDKHHASEQWILEFLKQWLLGLFQGLENQPREVNTDILKSCGIACANPQAVEFFRKAWKRSQNIEQFIETLNHHYQEEVFIIKPESSIQVRYSKCYCPLRQIKLVDSSLLRNCSHFWLEEVFESALNVPVKVKIVKTMCSGANSCIFKVSLPSKDENSLLEIQVYLKEALKLRQQIDEGLRFLNEKNKLRMD